MLRIDRDPLAYCPEAANLQILVVILDKGESVCAVFFRFRPACSVSVPASFDSPPDIDWRFMSKVAANRRVEERMSADPWFRHKALEAKGGKKLFTFDRPKYEDGVVVAKYRSPDQPNRFARGVFDEVLRLCYCSVRTMCYRARRIGGNDVSVMS